MTRPAEPCPVLSKGAGEEPGSASRPRSGWRTWILVVEVFPVPGVLYAMLLVVTFLPLTTGHKLWGASGLVVAAEGTFLLSALILGREAGRRHRGSLDPRCWFGGSPR